MFLNFFFLRKFYRITELQNIYLFKTNFLLSPEPIQNNKICKINVEITEDPKLDPLAT